MTEDLNEVVGLFGAFLTSMKYGLKHTIDMYGDIMYGTAPGRSGGEAYSYVAIPIKCLDDGGIDKDNLDKLFSLMAFFVDNAIGAGNIYLTNRNGKLVIEIAW